MLSGSIYGVLYNWYAVDDARGIAASGWHVPTQTEFETLVTYLGGSAVAGGKMKEIGEAQWYLISRAASSRFATNSSKFSAVGGGNRSYANGNFLSLRKWGYHWTTTVYPSDPTNQAMALYLRYNTVISTIGNFNKKSGLSVRLIKDSTTLANGETGTYTGNDGKDYITICIGTQEWLADNLCETKYANDDAVTIVTDNDAWAALATEACCAYDNEWTFALADYSTQYILGYYDRFGCEHQIHFQTKNYAGGISYMKGGESPATLNYEISEEFTHSPIKASSLGMEIVEEEEDTYLDLFDVDKRARVIAYKDNVIYWRGWTTAQDYSVIYNQTPRTVSVIAVDGLSFLKDIPLKMNSGEIMDPDFYTLKKYIRQAIDEIGLETDIYESLDLYEYRMDSNESPLTETSVNTYAFYNASEDVYKSLYEVLEDILTVFCARIYQNNGDWYINHVRQLKEDSITYRRYDSTFTEQSTVSESSLVCSLTKSSDPTYPKNTPKFSLRKELDRPYSELKITTNFNLNENLVRYPKSPDDVVGTGVEYYISDEDQLVMKGVYNAIPNNRGVVYNLGRVDFLADIITLDSGKADFMTFNIGGSLRGKVRIRLWVENEGDGYTYYYTNSYSAGSKSYDKTWNRQVLVDPSNTSEGALDLLFKEQEILGNAEEFSEVVEVVTDGKDLIGEMYLMIGTPYYEEVEAQLYVNLDELSLTYNACTLNKKEFISSVAEVQSNKKEISINLYSEPYSTLHPFGDTLLPLTLGYLNPHLVYPGLLYYFDGTHYIPGRYFIRLDTDESQESIYDLSTRAIGDVMLEDIMAFYAEIKWKVTGTIIGDFNFGNVIEYKNRRYMIVSMINNLRYAEIEVVLLEITTVGEESAEWLITESGSEAILTEESGEHIVRRR